MNLTLTEIPRVFLLGKDKTRLPDPNPAYTPEQVLSFYSGPHPELTTATIGAPVIEKDEQVFVFSTTVGVKG